MKNKQRLYIYGRKEMGVLVFLAVMIVLFAFTLGIHLGKQVGGVAKTTSTSEFAAVPTGNDKVPNRQEILEQTTGVDAAIDESLNQAVHSEVVRTGVKLDKPVQVELPEKTKVEVTAADATKKAEQSILEDEEEDETNTVNVDEAVKRKPPQGAFTLQIGAYHDVNEANDRVKAIEAAGQKPFVRFADLKNKGKWYRIYLGGYISREEAERAGKHLKDEKIVDSYVIAKTTE